MQRSTDSDSALRHADLRQMLDALRRTLQNQIQSGVRDGRSDRMIEVGDELDHADADSQGDIAFALLQMRVETLARIDQALVHIDAGEYGACIECAETTSERRLRALPFAVRCQACAEKREQRQRRERQLALSSRSFTSSRGEDA